MERAAPRRAAPSACSSFRMILLQCFPWAAVVGWMCVNPMADPVANPLANPRPPSTCSTESCNWDLSKVPRWLWVTFLGSLSRGEPLSGSFICIDILGSGLLRRSNLSWSPLPKCFALLYPYFASNFPCRWFLPSLIPGACHNKPRRRKPRPSRVVTEIEAQTCLGGRAMEEAEIQRCGWLWCAAAHSRPVLGTH